MSETDLSASVNVLRFCAGSLHLGIAAKDVMSVQPAAATHETTVHIGAIFGVVSTNSEQRAIHVAPTLAGERVLGCFNADLPIEVISCHSSDILPLPAGIPPEQWRPVMGVLRLSRQLVLLLDIPSVMAKLMETTQGEAL